MSPETLLALTSPCAPLIDTSPLTEPASTTTLFGIATSKSIDALPLSSSFQLPRRLFEWLLSSHAVASSYSTQTTMPRDVCSTVARRRSSCRPLPCLKPWTSTRPDVDGTIFTSPLTFRTDTVLPAETGLAHWKSARRWAPSGRAAMTRARLASLWIMVGVLYRVTFLRPDGGAASVG